ncbi:hypothetical protein A21D_02712 [Virgibacillus dokdonensis]|uniref:Uncharacterized protein n=1 Tax=Virgibacillus dokdonensis TaxID=302167 RepID=A0A2K9J1C7_9BACI|nr:hypothetical protein A21D_02712 [Virgibacillus dokdonensis]
MKIVDLATVISRLDLSRQNLSILEGDLQHLISEIKPYAPIVNTFIRYRNEFFQKVVSYAFYCWSD